MLAPVRLVGKNHTGQIRHHRQCLAVDRHFGERRAEGTNMAWYSDATECHVVRWADQDDAGESSPRSPSKTPEGAGRDRAGIGIAGMWRDQRPRQQVLPVAVLCLIEQAVHLKAQLAGVVRIEHSGHRARPHARHLRPPIISSAAQPNSRPAMSDQSNDEVITGHPGRYWHQLEDSRIQCDVCPRFCKLHEGQRGLCFGRARQDERIVLTTYGRSSGFCIDPIEKKPLAHFLPGSSVLSFGTAGCNLTCKFCQNWDISKARAFDRLQAEASPEQIADAAARNGCRSVAYTYNDPVVFLEYAVDVARACRARGVRNVAVSAGYVAPEARREFFASMDAANIDLKAFTEGFYR